MFGFQTVQFSDTFFQTVSEIQTFYSYFRHVCEMSEMQTLLFGFQTPYLHHEQEQKSFHSGN